MRTKLFLILVISLVACNPTPSAPSSSSAPIVGSVVPVGQPEIRDLGPSTETVWNCGSGGGTVVKHPSMSVATNWAVEWEVGGTAGTGLRIGDGVIPGGVDLSVSLESHYANKFDQSVQQGTGWDLPAEPNTVVVYTLMWREVWQPGYIDVRLADQSVVKVNVRYRTGIQSEIVGKQQQGCGTGQQTSQPIPTQVPTLVQPTSASTASAGPFREHRQTSIVGTGVLAQGTYSDGMAPFSETDISGHLNIQRIRLEENPDGCGVAFLSADKIWFGSSVKTTLTINGVSVGTINGPTGKHGYIFNVHINVGDRICVTYFEPSGFHILFGPDLYYHYDSYCYRGNC